MNRTVMKIMPLHFYLLLGLETQTQALRGAVLAEYNLWLTPAPVFTEHLLWIQLYARGGGNTKNDKPWPLPTRGSQFGSEYRMNLQETFCFRTIMYEAEIVRAMDAGSWIDG